MKITLETTYSNVTEQWLQWWLDDHMKKVLPEKIINEIKQNGFAIMTSRNFSDGVTVETVYKITY